MLIFPKAKCVPYLTQSVNREIYLKLQHIQSCEYFNRVNGCFQVTLSYDLHKYTRLLWESFELIPVTTRTVKVQALNWYTVYTNGFSEVEFYTIVDECSNGVADCHTNAICTDINIHPGYLCTCLDGFYGDAKTSGFGCQGNVLPL